MKENRGTKYPAPFKSPNPLAPRLRAPALQSCAARCHWPQTKNLPKRASSWFGFRNPPEKKTRKQGVNKGTGGGQGLFNLYLGGLPGQGSISTVRIVVQRCCSLRFGTLLGISEEDTKRQPGELVGVSKKKHVSSKSARNGIQLPHIQQAGVSQSWGSPCQPNPSLFGWSLGIFRRKQHDTDWLDWTPSALFFTHLRPLSPWDQVIATSWYREMPRNETT